LIPEDEEQPPEQEPSSPQAPVVHSDPTVNVERLIVPKSRRKLARKGVKVLAGCDVECVVTLELHAPERAVDPMGLGSTLLTKGTAVAPAGQAVWVRARMVGWVRRALVAYRGGGRLRVSVTASAP
jgi:hypothetical protein